MIDNVNNKSFIKCQQLSAFNKCSNVLVVTYTLNVIANHQYLDCYFLVNKTGLKLKDSLCLARSILRDPVN